MATLVRQLRATLHGLAPARTRIGSAGAGGLCRGCSGDRPLAAQRKCLDHLRIARQRKGAVGMKQLNFSLKPLAPYDLSYSVWLLRRRPTNELDRWEDRTYHRVVLFGGRPVALAVTQTGPRERPELEVSALGRTIGPAEKPALARLLARMLGTEVDLAPFYRTARRDSQLDELVQRFRGFKPPRFPSLFETLANAILCQQISLNVGLALIGRVARRWGLALAPGNHSPHAFARPADLRSARPQDLRRLGLSRHKAAALLNLAAIAARDEQAIEGICALGDAPAMERLLALRGVGPWSAEYALLRGLGRLHFFPAGDVAAQKNLARWLALEHPPDTAETRRLVARWHPYEGLVYLHLLLFSLSAKGYL